MKKILLISALAAASLQMSAQWNSDFTANTAISDPARYGAMLPIVRPTDEGKIWVSWLQWSNGMSAYVKAQLIDPDGTVLFDDYGLYVAKQLTPTWTNGYDMQPTPDGGCIVFHCDARNEVTYPENPQLFDPYVYKIDREGNFLWGLDGVPLPSQESYVARPKVGVTNSGNIILGYIDSKADQSSMRYLFMKLNDDGTQAWPEPMVFDGSFGAFYPCEDDDLYFSVVKNGGINLYRMDSLGDWVWANPVIVENREPNVRNEVTPIPDGKGGVFMSFQRYLGVGMIRACIQHITPDGETTMGLQSLDLSEEPGTHSIAGLGINSENEEVLAFWNHYYAEENHLLVQKYSWYGEPLWDEPVELDTQHMYGFSTTDCKLLDDGSAILVYGVSTPRNKENLKAARIDPDGNIVWEKSFGSEAHISRPTPVYLDDRALLFWVDNRISNAQSAEGTIWGQNFSYADGTGGVISVDAITAESADTVTATDGAIRCPFAGTLTIYSPAGAIVASFEVNAGINMTPAGLPAGLYIYRLNGESKSVSGKLLI